MYPGKASAKAILSETPGQLHTVADVGVQSNRLIFGDNFLAMLNIKSRQTPAQKIRLAYLDPPFATGLAFNGRDLAHAYEDTLNGAQYIEFLRKRLILIRELLSDDGSIYIHLDSNMAFPIKVVLDEIFGPKQFRNCITRKKSNPKNYTSKQFGNISDYILFYSKSKNYVWNQPKESWTEEWAEREYSYSEADGRKFKKVPIHAPGVRNGDTGKPWRGKLPPPGKHWQLTPSKLEELNAAGEIFWSKTGNPRRKVYLDRKTGVSVQDIWLDFKDAHNQNIDITGYPTEKNPDLISRIIRASSNAGDVVLDPFIGSGTVAAVAQELGRTWIGIDSSISAIDHTLKRLIVGREKMGDYIERPVKEKLLVARNDIIGGLSLDVEGARFIDPLITSKISEWRVCLGLEPHFSEPCVEHL